MAIATSYNVTSTQGAREDLTNSLRRVNPSDCPLFSTLPQGPAPKALLHEVLVDDLPLPVYGSPPADGTDLAFDGGFTNEIANRVRIGNRVQKFQRSASVSPLAEMIDVAGPNSSLLAQSKARVLTALRTDIEAGIGSNQALAVGDNATGDKLEGLMSINNPNNTAGMFDTAAKQAFRSIGGAGAVDGSAANSRFSATANTLTEAHFRNLLQTVYEGGGKAGSYRLYCGPSIMNTLSGFSRAVNAVTGTGGSFDANIQGTTLTLSIVKLVTDFGEIDIIPSLFLMRTSGGALGAASRNAGALLPTDDTVTLNFMEPINVIDLPDVGGGGDRFLTRAHLTLSCKNARALGSIV